MTFWSGESIRKHLTTEPVTLIDHPDLDCIDGAAYRLKVGPEYYVSATDLDLDHNTRTLAKLEAGQAFCIPGGQIALILTEEIVKFPLNALGFFSIKSSVKWKGMINVSGFHIDPGFWGRLTIAVYNAGSTTIQLRRGDPVFLMWIADLHAQSDAEYARYREPDESPVTQIDVDNVLNKAPGETESIQSLGTKIRLYEEKIDGKIKTLDARVETFGLRNTLMVWVGAALVTLAFSLAGNLAYDKYLKPEPAGQQTPTSSPASSAQPSWKPPKAHT